MPVLQVAIDARGARSGAGVADRAFKKVRGASKLTRNELGRFQKRVVGVGAALKGVRGSLLGFFGAFSAALVIRQAITLMSEFEEIIVTVGKVSTSTSNELLALEVTARKLGATTRFTAKEAGEGLLFLARAGFNTRAAIEALPGTLNLAQAGALNLGEAADLASNILKQFELAVSDTNRVVDDLINVSNRANTNVRQLGQAMSFIGPIANAAGQSIEVTAAQIGVLGDAGIQASRAGTALRGIMLALASATPEASRTFKELGLDLEKMKREGASTTEILESLAKAGLDIGKAADIFGRRNAAAAIIIGKAAERVRELTKAQLEGRGAALDMAKAMDDTLSGALKGLNSSFQELLLAIGDTGLAGSFRNFIEAITDGLRFIVGLREGFKGTAQRAAQVAAAMKLVVVLFTAMIALKVASVVLGIATAMVKLAAASTSVALATSPIIAIFGVLAAAIFGIEVGRFFASEFKIVQEFANGFAFGFLSLVAKIKNGWKLAVLGMKFLWAEFTQFITNTFASALGAVADLYQGFADTFPTAAKVLGIDQAGRQFGAIARRIKAENKNTSTAIIVNIQKVARQGAAELKIISDAALKAKLELDAAFGDTTRRGQTFFNFVKKDINDAITSMGGLNVQTNLMSKVTLDINTLLKDSTSEIKKAGDETEKMGMKIKAVTAEAKLLKSAVQSVTNVLTDGIFDAITGAKSLREILKDTGRQISQQIAKQAIASAIGGALGSLVGTTAAPAGLAAGGQSAGAIPSALGNVFASGKIVPMANGGIITSPTTFPLRGGRTGLAGEAGPEAILPLTRKNGKLGVQSSGEGGKNVTIIQNFNITTPNPDSFRASRQQIFADAGAGIKGSI